MRTGRGLAAAAASLALSVMGCSPGMPQAGESSALPTPAVAASTAKTPQDVGCTPDGSYYGALTSQGATLQEALGALVTEAFGDARAYDLRRLPAGRMVLVRDGRPSATGWVGRNRGAWSMSIDGSCAERLRPAPNWSGD